MADYLNAVDSTIPEVRVRRISLSSGGNTIIEDNPHIVETGFEGPHPRTAEIAARVSNAVDEFYDITSGALTIDERREYIARAWSGDNFRIAVLFYPLKKNYIMLIIVLKSDWN